MGFPLNKARRLFKPLISDGGTFGRGWLISRWWFLKHGLQNGDESHGFPW